MCVMMCEELERESLLPLFITIKCHQAKMNKKRSCQLRAAQESSYVNSLMYFYQCT